MLATLIANIASGEALLAFRRAKVTFIVYALCAFLALIGFVFLLVGAYLYAAAHFGPMPSYSFSFAIAASMGHEARKDSSNRLRWTMMRSTDRTSCSAFLSGCVTVAR